MAKMEVRDATALMRQLGQLGKVEVIAPKMIEAGQEVIAKSLKKELKRHVDTGELQRSVKPQKVKKTKTGAYFGKVIFDGYDPNTPKTTDFPRGTPNAVKAMGLEYGSSRQQAQPFMTKALNNVEDEVNNTMQKVLNREAGGGE